MTSPSRSNIFEGPSVTHSQPRKPFRVLALDGGGIRGAFAAAFLARIERELRAPVTNFFDLIVGTSTGGIIALGLGLGEPSERIRDLYARKGSEIFTLRKQPKNGFLRNVGVTVLKRSVPEIDERTLFRSKYTAEPLTRVLTEVFGDRTLEAAKSARIAIPAVNLTYGQTIVFKTPHRPDFVRDRNYKAVDVALATAAAPLYFPPSLLESARFADGGLWANNPSIVGYAEAAKIHLDCRRPGLDPSFDLGDIRLLSIGTGEPEYSLPDDRATGEIQCPGCISNRNQALPQ